MKKIFLNIVKEAGLTIDYFRCTHIDTHHLIYMIEVLKDGVLYEWDASYYIGHATYKEWLIGNFKEFIKKIDY